MASSSWRRAWRPAQQLGAFRTALDVQSDGRSFGVIQAFSGKVVQIFVKLIFDFAAVHPVYPGSITR